MDKIETLIASRRTVFNTQNLTVMWGIPERRRLLEDIKYYVRTKKLIRLHRGVYTLSLYASTYSKYELAQKLVPLSYISLSTALKIHGLSFQYDDSLHSVALISKTFTVGNQIIQYHQIKEHIFFDATGISYQKGFSLASPERAVCDIVYFFPGSGIDNYDGVDRKKLSQIASLYDNKRLEKEINKMLKKME